jgi:hypothetical protein
MALACDFPTLATADLADPFAVGELLDACMAVLFDPMLWLWAIGLTVAFGAIGALIGWWRDGRWLAGLAWGLVLGPLGWLVIAFGPSRRGPGGDAR